MTAVPAFNDVPAAQVSPVARLVAPVFHRLLDRIDAGLESGGIEAHLPDGTQRLIGGRAAGPLPVVTVHRWRALVRLATAGSVGWYEGWAAGDWSSPDPVPLFDLFMRNRRSLGSSARSGGVVRLAARVWHRMRRNDPTGSRKNIAAHYDLGNDFYETWLDQSLPIRAPYSPSRSTMPNRMRWRRRPSCARSSTGPARRRAIRS